jgi:hypothetical protein
MVDLWPDLMLLPDKKAPVVLLREQAGLLSDKTNGLILGQVDKSKSNAVRVGGKLKIVEFCYKFYLVAPALDNYRYKLFEIGHDIGLYPVGFNIEDEIKKEISPDGSEPLAKDEREYLEILKKIFNCSKTKTIIFAILSQLK